MNRTRSFHAVLLLCVLTLHTLSNSLILPSFEFTELQTAVSEQVNGTDSLTSGGTLELRNGDSDWKPPKHSFTDYSTFLSPSNFFLPYHPYVYRLLPYEPYQAQPRVFLEIVVPPDHA